MCERIDEIFDPEIVVRFGKVANSVRLFYEKETKRSAISKENSLNYNMLIKIN